MSWKFRVTKTEQNRKFSRLGWATTSPTSRTRRFEIPVATLQHMKIIVIWFYYVTFFIRFPSGVGRRWSVLTHSESVSVLWALSWQIMGATRRTMPSSRWTQKRWKIDFLFIRRPIMPKVCRQPIYHNLYRRHPTIDDTFLFLKSSNWHFVDDDSLERPRSLDWWTFSVLLHCQHWQFAGVVEKVKVNSALTVELRIGKNDLNIDLCNHLCIDESGKLAKQEA